MPWIRTRKPAEAPELREAYAAVRSQSPAEYAAEPAADSHLPTSVIADSIVGAHSLAPEVMRHLFAAFGAMMGPTLPLSRREHELVAATVSSLNRCFY
jgi:hypothetical protein